ncbi:unnamed protein product [Leptidea sinapis]|uniref:Uncharacterized protein n=1 Tax=Leptidea sinapis TaxID=189913 RepID=A0A5E4QEU4_9NEOP|nr:unnamed protein product [Leptidea sinapis]
MSLFRKPKKIQRRVFCAEDDEDGDPEAPPPPIISQNKKEKSIKKTPLLSFADEEEETEVFQVKKSSQSKRLAKRKEKKNQDPEENQAEKDITKRKKKVSLEGLILSGREALAADGKGDISDDSATEEEDNRRFHRFRAESVRAALAVAPGHIPDAALIHAARKTRQQARELGDFIPIKNDTAPGPRLIHEDDVDDDDEDDEGRIQVREDDDEMNSDINPFAVAPPPPRLEGIPTHLRSLTSPGEQPPTTAQELYNALSKRLHELQTERQETVMKRENCRERLLTSARIRESRAGRCQELDAAYKRAQAVRGYITDLIECLDEKLLESRALALHKRRCDFLVERRPRAGASKPMDSEEKRRRGAEREGRRRARRLKREAAACAACASKQRAGDVATRRCTPMATSPTVCRGCWRPTSATS